METGLFSFVIYKHSIEQEQDKPYVEYLPSNTEPEIIETVPKGSSDNSNPPETERASRNSKLLILLLVLRYKIVIS